jgi:hypothetical protein
MPALRLTLCVAVAAVRALLPQARGATAASATRSTLLSWAATASSQRAACRQVWGQAGLAPASSHCLGQQHRGGTRVRLRDAACGALVSS